MWPTPRCLEMDDARMVGRIPVISEQQDRTTPLIMIISDDLPFSGWLTVALAAEGYPTIRSVSTKEAYTAVQRDRPGLVILNIRHLASDHAWHVLQLLWLDRATLSIPTIVCCHNAELLMKKAQRLKEKNCQVLQKPISLDDLRATVATALTQRDADEAISDQ